ncbi:DEAD-domain-containing protein [Phlebopus sp. FC_14]|nr:DEAD-domain-containing protein [Phlebopus sp. FC_14]
MMDFVTTMDSDDERRAPKRSTQPDKDEEDVQIDPDFRFDGDPSTDLLQSNQAQDIVRKVSKPDPVCVDEIIERRKLERVHTKRKREESEPENDVEDSEFESSEEDNEGAEESEEDPLATSDEASVDSAVDRDYQRGTPSEDEYDTSDDSEQETQAEKDRKAAYFAPDIQHDKHTSFLTMNLSRPIQKALSGLGFHSPTPIQAATIPVALLGKDVVGGAVTGSGKTAAFTIPMLERLLYRDKGKHAAATRCLVLVPTRELAVQCFEVGSKLAAHTDIRFCLLVGGLSLKSQEGALRARPDVIIATPGRLIDHLRNSPSFTLDALDVLVLDEADRMLSEGFADELGEIIKACPVSRQTMLFSATMTDSVDELVRVSLNKPVRLFVDPKRSTAKGLVQEFVRVRAEKQADRTALLLALCKRTFKHGVIIFYRSKKLAHQIRIVFGLLDLKAEELHGDLSQEQRLKALQLFRDGQTDFLMATDLASRGLDIKGIETVINYDMPNQLAQYLHRVGRTARAGKSGRSITLVGEGDRKMLKAVIKQGSGEDNIRHRVIPADAVAKWAKRVEELKDEVSVILQEEKEEKQIRQAEMELRKGQNMIDHEAEIFSRPARTWFQSEKDKSKAAATSKQHYETGKATALKSNTKAEENTKPKRDKYSGLSRKAKRRKVAMDADKEFGDRGAVNAAIRSAKREARPGKIGLIQSKGTAESKKRKRIPGKVTSMHEGVFDRDMSSKGARGEGLRAKKGDAIGSMGKRKKGGKR